MHSSPDRAPDPTQSARRSALRFVPGGSHTDPRAASVAELVWEGDYWTIVFAHTELRVRDCKGIRYLAELLANPGSEIEAERLADSSSAATLCSREAADAGLSITGESDLGPILDPEAKRAYRQRLNELGEELDRASRFNDPHRALRARLERDAIIEQLASATGLGGRDRRTGAITERARVNVTRAIKAAITRIAEYHPELAAHLSNHVHTGRVCAYQPDRSAAVSWQVRTRPITTRLRSPRAVKPEAPTPPAPQLTVCYRHLGEWAVGSAARSSVQFARAS